MNREGVLLADDTLITPQSVESIDAETTTSASVEADVSGDKAKAVENKKINEERNEAVTEMGDKIDDEQDDDRVNVSIDITTLIIIIVGAVVGCCVCVVAVGFAIYFIGKSNGNNGNNGAQVSQRAVELKASPLPQAVIHANPIHPNKAQQQGGGFI